MTVAERIRNRRIGVLGMARSGLAAAKLAAKLGGQVFVSDSADESKLSEQINQLRQAGIPFETGGHSEQLLECDYFVISPGIPLSIEIIQKARENGIPIFSEIEFGYWVCKGKIVAVTGSNGKTTTTTLIGNILSQAGLKVFVCGNVGLPFCEVVDKIEKNDIAVVEISTFQLETIEDFRPDIALILNLSPDHLDRHGTFDVYKALKYRIAENQNENNFLILNRDDKILATEVVKTNATKLFFTTNDNSNEASFVSNSSLYRNVENKTEEIIKTGEIQIPGPHNLQNSAAAAVVSGLLDIPVEMVCEVLKSFSGVEHRLERIGKVAGISFINDSKATNVDSVCYAIRSVDTPICLIMGGRGKGASYAEIIKFGKDKIKSIYAIGEAREEIFEELGKAFPVSFVETLEDAVKNCFEAASPGETVLLSPGCASFDMFKNFEHRGQVFKEAVSGLRGNKNETITG